VPDQRLSDSEHHVDIDGISKRSKRARLRRWQMPKLAHALQARPFTDRQVPALPRNNRNLTSRKGDQ
jgi:hypothetical protein